MVTVSGLPPLTESDVRRWIGDESFRRGQRYFDQDAILNPRRAGMMLRAQCQGSRSQPYRVQIALGPKGIVSGDCSCPVGGGGHCKHAAALLLTWLDNADAFADVEDMATMLDRRSKAELIDLIGKMVERYPELEMLVELPVPGEATSKPMGSGPGQCGGRWRRLCRAGGLAQCGGCVRDHHPRGAGSVSVYA